MAAAAAQAERTKDSLFLSLEQAGCYGSSPVQAQREGAEEELGFGDSKWLLVEVAYMTRSRIFFFFFFFWFLISQGASDQCSPHPLLFSKEDFKNEC